MLEAAREARDAGIPFNRMITILWGQFGVTDVQASTSRFLKALKSYIVGAGYQTRYAWTIERGKRLGLHVHILIHMPPELSRAASYCQRGWLVAAGARFGKGLIRSKAIGGRLDTYRLSAIAQERFAVEHERTVAYVLKCCSFEMKNQMRSPFGCQEGLVTGRRSGRSWQSRITGPRRLPT